MFWINLIIQPSLLGNISIFNLPCSLQSIQYSVHAFPWNEMLCIFYLEPFFYVRWQLPKILTCEFLALYQIMFQYFPSLVRLQAPCHQDCVRLVLALCVVSAVCQSVLAHLLIDEHYFVLASGIVLCFLNISWFISLTFCWCNFRF